MTLYLYSTVLNSTELYYCPLLYCTVTELYSTLLYSTLLYSTVTELYSTLLYSTLLNSTELYHTVLYWTVTLLNCDFTELWLYWTVTLLNCDFTLLTLLHCYFASLNCNFTEMSFVYRKFLNLNFLWWHILMRQKNFQAGCTNQPRTNNTLVFRPRARATYITKVLHTTHAPCIYNYQSKQETKQAETKLNWNNRGHVIRTFACLKVLGRGESVVP